VSVLPLAGADCWNRIGVSGDGSCDRLGELVHCRNCPVFSEGGRVLFERSLPPGYSSEWTALLALPKPEEPVGTLAAALFRVGDEWLALEVAHVVQIGGIRPVRRIPHRSGEVLLGLVNVDGELVLCASLAALLGIPPVASEAEPARFLAVSLPGGRWVFPVQEVDGVHQLDSASLVPLPSTLSEARTRHARGLARTERRTVTLLDPDRLDAGLRERGGLA
jgi:chemotaxis-related protein WspD